jgi:hypothetical protein
MAARPLTPKPGNVYAATFGDNARFSRPQLRLDV